MQNGESRRRSRWAAIVAGWVAVTLGGFQNRAWSEDLPAPSSAAQSAGNLEQRVKVLERKLEIADENAAAKAKEAPGIKAGNEGFQLQSPDKAFFLKVRGLIQADSRQYVDDSDGTLINQFLLRRVRPILEGTIYRDFSFLIVPEFASDAKTALLDAYLDMAPWTFAKLRVGSSSPRLAWSICDPMRISPSPNAASPAS